LIYLINNGFIINRNFINVLIKSHKNESIPLLNLIFKGIHLNNDTVLIFLIYYYRNKIPLSHSELNTIIDKEKIKPYKSNIFENEYDPLDTPLFIALNKQYDAVLKYLIEQGVNTNVSFSISHRLRYYIYSPLSLACEKENELMVKILVEHSANVNENDENNEMIVVPLGIACEKENEELVKYLIEHGANVNAKIKTDDNIIKTP